MWSRCEDTRPHGHDTNRDPLGSNMNRTLTRNCCCSTEADTAVVEMAKYVYPNISRELQTSGRVFKELEKGLLCLRDSGAALGCTCWFRSCAEEMWKHLCHCCNHIHCRPTWICLDPLNNGLDLRRSGRVRQSGYELGILISIIDTQA